MAYNADELSERMMAALDRILDRSPLSGMSRGAVRGAIRATANEAYAEGLTAMHARREKREAK